MISSSARILGGWVLASLMYYNYSFALLGLTTLPPSTPAATRTNHPLLQAPALLSLLLPTLSSTSPSELTAGVCGTYGMRASTNVVSTAGIYSVSPLLDSVGVFARSAPVVEAVVKSLMESSSVPLKPRVKYKLLYPVRAKDTKPQDSRRWFPYPGEPGSAADFEELFEETIQKLESHLKCTRIPFNLDDLWRQTRPAGQDQSLDKATGGIYTVLTTHSCVGDTIDPFIADFKATNNGRSPFIDAVVKARQDHGRSTTTLQYETTVQSAKAFSQWFIEIVLARSAEDEFPLLIFPPELGLPNLPR